MMNGWVDGQGLGSGKKVLTKTEVQRCVTPVAALVHSDDYFNTSCWL